MKLYLWTLVLASAAVLGGCNSTPVPQPSPISALPAPCFARTWRATLDLHDQKATKIYLRDNLLFVYTDQNFSYVIKRDSGAVIGVNDVVGLGNHVFPPIILGDKIYYPTDNAVEVYNVANGRYAGEMTFDFSIRSPGVGEGHYLYFGADRTTGRLISVDVNEMVPNTSSHVVQRWDLATNTGKGVFSSPAVYQGVIYAAFGDGKIFAVNTDTRAGIWGTKDFNSPTGETGYFRADDDILADLRVDSGALYAASLDSKLYCINRTSGKSKWMYFAHEPLEDAPEVTATLVYELVRSRGLVAIDKSNPAVNVTPRWTVADGVQFLAEDEKYSYILCHDGGGNVITAVDKQTGEKKFTAKRTDVALFASNTKSAVIYGATASGEVLAITPNFKPGTMGELVMELHDEPMAVASAR